MLMVGSFAGLDLVIIVGADSMRGKRSSTGRVTPAGVD
jgi:hypothetical protein